MNQKEYCFLFMIYLLRGLSGSIDWHKTGDNSNWNNPWLDRGANMQKLNEWERNCIAEIEKANPEGKAFYFSETNVESIC